MERQYTYHKKEMDKESNILEMKRWFDKKQELDKFLEKIIKPYIENKELSIIDACCGIGHICYLLSKISPKSKFLGIDQTPYLIEKARQLIKEKNITFEVEDVYTLPSKYPKKFDICINWKTLSWLPYYDECVKSLFSITKKHIFISSLFYDGDIDFEIKVREYQKEGGKDGFNLYYNVYSYPHFRDFVLRLGAKNIECYDFEIGIDIPRPPINQMGTYTVKKEDGKRLQISGAIVMYWKVIRIDL